MNGIMNNHAVSESVGFIIIFGIMLTGIAMITLYGYPMLMQEQQNANIRNMERNMIVLQNDLKSLTYKNVPYEETMLQVAGGTMLIPENGGLNSTFEVNNGTPMTFLTGGILYNSQDGMTTISLENGAVHSTMWSSPEGSAMLSQPRWFYDGPTNTFVMTFITMNATSDLAQTGIGTVAMKLAEPPQQINATAAPGVQVEFKYEPKSPYIGFKRAWINYLDSFHPVLEKVSDNPPTYKLRADTILIIQQYNVTVLSL